MQCNATPIAQANTAFLQASGCTRYAQGYPKHLKAGYETAHRQGPSSDGETQNVQPHTQGSMRKFKLEMHIGAMTQGAHLFAQVHQQEVNLLRGDALDGAVQRLGWHHRRLQALLQRHQRALRLGARQPRCVPTEKASSLHGNEPLVPMTVV